ncbi:hypothetical protein KC909_04355 [Candidatus Dojkabacteria bacterium]|uniref:Uncharacterized protein n=1 Tax=Candidatus Dojkabacteria bacterium TaxID=2099670 RepID=A0A955L626_9BACT|nr:hypothetical protein [Candidatus Dojkabacteria bacterium]
MNKTWVTLIIISLGTIMLMVAYQFYVSLSGQNVEFAKTLENPIDPNLGTFELDYLNSIRSNVQIENEELEN